MSINITPDYIYIMGSGASGTTLLELLLDRNPDLISLGEIERFHLQLARGKDGLCSCGQIPSKCDIWIEVAERINEHYGIDVLKDPLKFRVSDVGWEEHLKWKGAFRDWLIHQNSRAWRYAYYRNIPILKLGVKIFSNYKLWAERRIFVARAVQDIYQAKGVIDKSKDYLSAIDLYKILQAKMRILYITRDVRAVTWSTIRRNYLGMGYEKEEIKNLSDHPDWKKILYDSISSWERANIRSLNMLKNVNNNHWMHIKYEDLCRDANETFRNIHEFLGYPFDENFINTKSDNVHTIAGNAIRFRPINEIKEDLSWQGSLSDCDLKTINDRTYDLQKELGYI